jgi:phasin family protein
MTDQKTDAVTAKADAPKAEQAPVVAAAAPKAAAEVVKTAAEAPAAAKPAKAKAARRTAKAAPAARRTAKAARKARKTRTAAAKAAGVRKAPARTARKTVKTAKTIQKIVTKGNREMKNEANQVAERIQAAFGDVNERAKTAIERNTRIAEEMTDLAKGNVEALVASTKLAAKGVEKIGQEVAEYSRKSFEDASTAIKGFAEVKSPADLFRLQGEFARTQFDSAIAESSKLSETMIKLAGDMFEPITSRYSVAAERVKNAVAL